jgi:predicted O-linked N-acetylglucosamine transferase (SPINDLY family)
LSGLLQSHDRGVVELVGLSIGPKVEGTARQFMEGLFESFVDLHGMGDEAAARRVRELELDIAVDLTGHTDNCRPGLFAMRMAPIQVNYLGYAGTMGAPYIDYMMADRVVIPPESRKHYSEKIVYLPHSFFPNDRRWPPMDRAFTRKELGLPEAAMVYCCFNGSQKINAKMFEVWARILKAVPESVLWVSDPGPLGQQNLAREAQARGVDPSRLVYAPKLPSLSDHIARHRQADLFLDTLPYNAHTTASDALWAGLPLVTCMGESFAARVAGSLLKAVGLPELVTERLEDYEALAIELGQDRKKRDAIKSRLWANRLTEPLFDSALYARHIEDAYRAMMDRYHEGEEPSHIEVAMRGVNPVRAQDLFRQGLAAHQRDALDEAKGLYEQALGVDGAHAGALHFYGVLLAQEGRAEEGLSYLERAVAAQPGQAEVHYNRGKILKQVGRLEEAEASYQEALRYNPRYADAHHNLGNLYLDRKAWQQAEKAYLKALEIDPKNINAQESLQRLRRDQHMQGMFSLSHLRPAQLTPLSTSQFVPASIKMLSLDDLQSKT